MNSRRQFLRSFSLTATGLFVPAKTFFLPPKGGWLGDLKVGPEEITAASALRLLAKRRKPMMREINEIMMRRAIDSLVEEVESYGRFCQAVRAEPA